MSCEKEIEKEVETLVDKLYDFNDNFVQNFGIEKLVDKKELLEMETKKTIEQLKGLEEKCPKTFYLLQCGRALNVLPDYNSECEEYLSKVVKRDPSIVTGWNMLGETFWKKGDILASKNCFEGALKRERNKVSLRSLSMVLRQLKEEKLGDSEKHVLDSVTCAKDAVQMDMNDGVSWYILGNAYLSVFFLTEQNPQILNLALKSYGKSESANKSSKNDPDLHFNRAQAYKYKEDFTSALNGWKTASELDPSWPEPPQKIDEIVKYLDKTIDLINLKGKLKNRRIQTLLNSFSSNDLGPYLNGSYLSEGKKVKFVQCFMCDLNQGNNVGKVITIKVLCNMADLTLVPFTFIAMDKNSAVFAVTVYNLNKNSGVIIGDTVVIPNPLLLEQDIEWKDGEISKQWKFKCIRVNNPVDLVVNKRKYTTEHCAFTKAAMTATDSTNAASAD